MNDQVLSHQLTRYFDALAALPSTRAVRKSLLYRSLADEIESALDGYELGQFAREVPYEKKPFYRAVAWNIERGVAFNGILHFLKNHPDLNQADFLFLTETDVGMARSGNRNVARDLAVELGMNYFFAPAYLNLSKGNAVERHYGGENTLALHGNALLSRYPIENPRVVSLFNCKDKMRGREKRLGCQKALVCEIALPLRKITLVLAHLDAHSSHRQRAAQMRTVLEAVKHNRYPILLGGDLNTNTYNTRKAVFAFFGFWNKVFRGVDGIIDNHYPYPYRYFDRRLFGVLKDYEFDYETFNELGVGTCHYSVEDIKGNYLVREVVPEWCRRIMENTLRRHGGRVSLKLDWFAGKWLKVANASVTGASQPRVIGNLIDAGALVSDHDAIIVDVDVY